MDLYTAPAAPFLTIIAQLNLIADAQDVPVTVTADDDGTESVTYGKTAASEAALETLTLAFMPSIRKAAGLSKVLDRDGDALGIVLAEFVATVRRHDLTSDVPFSATISTILQRCISDADRTSDLITVKENVAARYFRLMHVHNHDVTAAYAECATTSNGFDPITFLAVHRAMTGISSLDVQQALGNGGPHSKDGAGRTNTISGHEAALGTVTDTADDYADRDLVRWLYTQVTDRQETVLRAAYGFRDSATENLMVAHNLRPGEVLTDAEVSEVITVSRATVQRERKAGLSTMRDSYAELLNESSD